MAYAKKILAQLKRCGIEVRRMGPIERGAKYRWVDGYAVFVDGKESQPWAPIREAVRLAKEVGKGRCQR